MPRRVIFWILLFAAAVCVDVPVSDWVHASPVLGEHLKHDWPRLLWIIRLPGHFYFTLVLAAALVIFHPSRWHAAALVALAGAFSGLNWLVKWIVGRIRPFHGVGPFTLRPMGLGLRGLFGAEHDLSFPSGDVCLAAATAASIALLFPKWRAFAWGVVILVAMERIAESAHYPCDTVAGAAGGVLAFLAARRLLACQGVQHPPSTEVSNGSRPEPAPARTP